MKRSISGIVFGFGISLLFFLSVQAFVVHPSLWTMAGAATMGALSVVLWAGFGRALYDVFVAGRGADARAAVREARRVREEE